MAGNIFVERDDVIAVVGSFLACNRGDGNTEELLLSVGAELLDISEDTMSSIIASDPRFSIKRNAEYWDEIDNIALACVRNVAGKSMGASELSDTQLLDVSKEVVELVTQRLEKDFGCEFPVVEGEF